MRTPPRLAILAFGALATSALADNLACQGTGMDWYINMVGETPCLTYQKLRQICNSQFAVGVMDVNTPPDACTDQVSTCCCNTVAFALSMLCLNCQQNISTSTGLDAGAGAYQIYLDQGTSTSCANPQSDKLPADIQTAVCNEKVKIADDLYSNGWPDGSWFYVYTRDTLTKDNIVANNNSFTHCASTTLSSSSSSQHPSSSSSATSTSASAKPSGTAETATAPPSTKLGSGAIAGLAVGVALLLGLVGAGAWWWWRRRGRRGGGAVGPGGVFGQPETAAVDESLVAHGELCFLCARYLFRPLVVFFRARFLSCACFFSFLAHAVAKERRSGDVDGGSLLPYRACCRLPRPLSFPSRLSPFSNFLSGVAYDEGRAPITLVVGAVHAAAGARRFRLVLGAVELVNEWGCCAVEL
ncbi:hypothetical protein B0H17DRAFT_340426 [Mycena rosella]|uniref:Uncharacterized protein n=1 Tax=Mycena rosella TaxID=1033263 RepID=A0AAD7DRE0_MYCRO|nr:hypothetical protein B0H17DRAFT_340426 [Mycena rosella]